MTIAQRLYLFALISLLGLLILGGVGLFQMHSINQETAKGLNDIAEGIDDMVDLKAAHVAFKTQIQEWKNILIRGQRREDYDKHLKQFGDEEARVQSLLDKTVTDMRKAGKDKEAAEVAALAQEHRALGSRYREALKSYEAGDREAAQKIDRAVKGMDRATAQGLDTFVAKYEEAELQRLKQEGASVQSLYEKGRNAMLAIVLVVLALSGFIVFQLVRGIRGTLDGMRQAVEDIPRSWDLRKRVPVVGRDEIAQTAQSINLLLQNFHEVVGRITANARQTATSCRSLATSLQQVEKAVAQQHDATSTMAAAVEQLTTSFSQIHGNATDSLAASQEATQSAISGNLVITQASDAMSGVVGSVQEAASVIERVGSQTSNITAIVQVIREVADQTNLLALNAAIEAARAGEQGRGFAVVADEVRKLAEKTTSSSEEIRRMIDVVQQSAGEAVGNIRRVVDQVDVISQKSREAQSAMVGIREHTQKSEGFAHDITYALGEQSSASTLIAQNVETVARMSEQNANNVKGAESAMRALEDESRVLQEAVSRFVL